VTVYPHSSIRLHVVHRTTLRYVTLFFVSIKIMEITPFLRLSLAECSGSHRAPALENSFLFPTDSNERRYRVCKGGRVIKHVVTFSLRYRPSPFSGYERMREHVEVA
jgi:hypothetical protein